MDRSRRLLVIVAAMALVAPMARSDLVTFAFTGEVTDFLDGSGVGWTVPIGAPFDGLITFDSSTPDSSPEFPEVGRYPDSIVSSSFTIGDHSTIDTGVSGTISVGLDIEDADLYVLRDRSLSFRGYAAIINLIFIDYDLSVFDTDALPLAPPPLEAFEEVDWSMGTENSDFAIIGSIDSMTLVPEPSSILLLAGLTALVTKRRSRRAAVGADCCPPYLIGALGAGQ